MAKYNPRRGDQVIYTHSNNPNVPKGSRGRAYEPHDSISTYILWLDGKAKGQSMVIRNDYLRKA